jgi:hypothetical protein
MHKWYFLVFMIANYSNTKTSKIPCRRCQAVCILSVASNKGSLYHYSKRISMEVGLSLPTIRTQNTLVHAEVSVYTGTSLR